MCEMGNNENLEKIHKGINRFCSTLFPEDVQHCELDFFETIFECEIKPLIMIKHSD